MLFNEEVVIDGGVFMYLPVGYDCVYCCGLYSTTSDSPDFFISDYYVVIMHVMIDIYDSKWVFGLAYFGATYDLLTYKS